MNRPLFTTMNATHGVLSYMPNGVYAEWDGMVRSNKNANRKSTSCNTRMHVIGVFFLFPLVAGSFAERKTIIPVLKMMKIISQSALHQLRDAFMIPTPCHGDDTGVILPLSAITGTNYYNVYTA